MFSAYGFHIGEEPTSSVVYGFEIGLVVCYLAINLLFNSLLSRPYNDHGINFLQFNLFCKFPSVHSLRRGKETANFLPAVAGVERPDADPHRPCVAPSPRQQRLPLDQDRAGRARGGNRLLVDQSE